MKMNESIKTRMKLLKHVSVSKQFVHLLFQINQSINKPSGLFHPSVPPPTPDYEPSVFGQVMDETSKATMKG